MQAQETLLKLPWPERLLQDDFCRNVTAGDVWNDPRVAGQGSLVMSGLRVRMGINTGALGSCKGVQLVVFKIGLGYGTQVLLQYKVGAQSTAAQSLALLHTCSSGVLLMNTTGIALNLPALRRRMALFWQPVHPLAPRRTCRVHGAAGHD